LEFGGHGSQICDPLNLMDTDGKDSLEGIIVIAQEKLNEVNQPIVFAVVLVDKIPSSFVTGGNIDLATEKFARGLHDEWQLGDKVKQNGALLFISTLDRSYFLSVGDFLNKNLSPASIDFMFDTVKPAMKEAQWAFAFSLLIRDISGRFMKEGTAEWKASMLDNIGNQFPHANKYQMQAMRNKEEGDGDIIDWISDYIGLFIMLVVGLAAYFMAGSVSRRTQLTNGRSALERFAKEVKSTDDNRFNLTTCAICLDPFANNESIDISVSDSVEDDESEISAVVEEEVVVEGEKADSTVESNTDSSASASATATPTLSSNRPMSLPCGHVFCAGCLEDYLKTNAKTCPICRQVFDSDDDTGDRSTTSRRTTTPSSASSSSSYGSFRNRHRHYGSSSSCFRMSNQARTQDTLFRMGRLRTLYPDVMTADTLNAMTVALGREGNYSTIAQIAETRRDLVTQTIAAMATSSSRGKSGSSFRSSFSGGGRSSGGRGGRF